MVQDVRRCSARRHHKSSSLVYCSSLVTNTFRLFNFNPLCTNIYIQQTVYDSDVIKFLIGEGIPK